MPEADAGADELCELELGSASKSAEACGRDVLGASPLAAGVERTRRDVRVGFTSAGLVSFDSDKHYSCRMIGTLLKDVFGLVKTLRRAAL